MVCIHTKGSSYHLRARRAPSEYSSQWSPTVLTKDDVMVMKGTGKVVSRQQGSESNRKRVLLVAKFVSNPLGSLDPSNDHNVASPEVRPRTLTIQQQRCHTASKYSMSSSQHFTRDTVVPLLPRALVNDAERRPEMSSCTVALHATQHL